MFVHIELLFSSKRERKRKRKRERERERKREGKVPALLKGETKHTHRPCKMES